MSYEEFTAEIAEREAKQKIEAFAKVQSDGVHFCPRCGHMTVKEQLHTNALSRHVNVYICDECGTDEAIRDWIGTPLPLREWAISRLPVVAKASTAPPEPNT